MVQSKAVTVEEYLDELPPERKQMMVMIRDIIQKNLPAGYKEGMQFGMIGYFVPLSTYPKTYNKQPLVYVALASQKNYVSLYLTNVYSDKTIEAWFLEEYAKSGKKLDKGKSCVRFKRAEDIPLDLIGKTIARTPLDAFIKKYEKIKENDLKKD